MQFCQAPNIIIYGQTVVESLLTRFPWVPTCRSYVFVILVSYCSFWLLFQYFFLLLPFLDTKKLARRSPLPEPECFPGSPVTRPASPPFFKMKKVSSWIIHPLFRDSRLTFISIDNLLQYRRTCIHCPLICEFVSCRSSLCVCLSLSDRQVSKTDTVGI